MIPGLQLQSFHHIKCTCFIYLHLLCHFPYYDIYSASVSLFQSTTWRRALPSKHHPIFVQSVVSAVSCPWSYLRHFVCLFVCKAQYVCVGTCMCVHVCVYVCMCVLYYLCTTTIFTWFLHSFLVSLQDAVRPVLGKAGSLYIMPLLVAASCFGAANGSTFIAGR